MRVPEPPGEERIPESYEGDNDVKELRETLVTDEGAVMRKWFEPSDEHGNGEWTTDIDISAVPPPPIGETREVVVGDAVLYVTNTGE